MKFCTVIQTAIQSYEERCPKQIRRQNVTSPVKWNTTVLLNLVRNYILVFQEITKSVGTEQQISVHQESKAVKRRVIVIRLYFVQ